MKLVNLHLREYARVDGSMAQTFASPEWDMELRADLGGVIISRKNRENAEKRDTLWIPMANVRNGTPAEVPTRGK